MEKDVSHFAVDDIKEREGKEIQGVVIFNRAFFVKEEPSKKNDDRQDEMRHDGRHSHSVSPWNAMDGRIKDPIAQRIDEKIGHAGVSQRHIHVSGEPVLPMTDEVDEIKDEGKEDNNENVDVRLR